MHGSTCSPLWCQGAGTALQSQVLKPSWQGEQGTATALNVQGSARGHLKLKRWEAEP